LAGGYLTGLRHGEISPSVRLRQISWVGPVVWSRLVCAMKFWKRQERYLIPHHCRAMEEDAGVV
jgi:hypothetical protein